MSRAPVGSRRSTSRTIVGAHPYAVVTEPGQAAIADVSTSTENSLGIAPPATQSPSSSRAVPDQHNVQQNNLQQNVYPDQSRYNYLLQQLQLVYSSPDPTIVDQAWTAISQARQEAEQWRQALLEAQTQNSAQVAVVAARAEAAVTAAEASASASLAQANAANSAAEARVAATERVASAAVENAEVRARAAQETASAQVQAAQESASAQVQATIVAARTEKASLRDAANLQIQRDVA